MQHSLCDETLATEKTAPGAAAVVDPSWRATFDFFDIDRSGTISTEELQKCLQAMGQKITEAQVKDMISQADSDQSGEIDYPEFVQLMLSKHVQEISHATLKKYFNTMDKDRSGYITTAELCHSLTGLHQDLSDEEMNKIMNRYDVDGNGQLTLPEFEMLVKDHGITVVEGGEEQHAAEVLMTTAPEKQPDPIDELMAVSDRKLAEVLKPLANAEGKVRLSDVQHAVDLWQKYHGVDKASPEDNPSLHWEKGRVEAGLGEVIYKANHIALTVSDVGRSAAFYSDVLGLQQIRRPDFDRHGAWFTMGNVELHLIKGVPIVHSRKDLIVGHIAIETYNIDRVPTILERLGVPFRQNVSVPSGRIAQGSGDSVRNVAGNIVKQYFLRDPDGYYIEICNCDVLTKYCLGDIDELAGYDQGVALDSHEAGVFVNVGLKIASNAYLWQKQLEQLAQEMKGCSVAEIAERLGCKVPAESVDEEKLKNLLVRCSIYGDVCQNEDKDSLRGILLAAGNNAPLAMRIMEVRAIESQTFAPPVVFEQGKRQVVPESFRMSKKPAWRERYVLGRGTA